MNLSRAIQDTIYPIMGNYCSPDDCMPLDLSTASSYEGHPIDHPSLKLAVPAFLARKKARLGYGGYREKRALYRASTHFSGNAEERDIHLGIDIWVPGGTPVYAPIDGIIHSCAYNGARLDYGHTLVLQHLDEGRRFHTLYGHLSRSMWDHWTAGQPVEAGNVIAHIGEQHENGGWYPHLHFQVIIDMEGKRGDYPGVCAEGEKEHYFANCPDPSSLIRFRSAW